MVWKPCDNFSIDEQQRYISKFRARSLVLLSSVSQGLDLGDLLDFSKSAFNTAQQEKLYAENNAPVTRYLLSRALVLLEEKNLIYFYKTGWRYGRKPEQDIKTPSSH